MRTSLFRPPQRPSLCFEGGQRFLGPFANEFPLLLSQCREDVDGEVVGRGHIAGHELDFGVHQGRDETEVSGEPVQLGNDQCSALLFGVSDGLEQARAVALLPALDVLIRSQDHAALAVGVDRGTLGGKAQSALALLG